MLDLCSGDVAEAAANADTEDEQQRTTAMSTVDFESDSDTEEIPRGETASLILDMVSQCRKTLFRIGMIVRKATPRDRFERALQQSDFAFPVQFDTTHVEEISFQCQV